MQHAWAEIEHDIRYKSAAAIPKAISRRFMTLAGLLEIADREFQEIQEQDEAIRANARTLIDERRLTEVEVTPDALRSYLDMRLGVDERISDYSYDWQARTLRRLGFQNLGQVDECIGGFDDDQLSRAAYYGSRRGQLSRFEILLVAGMGENYCTNHPWSQNDWYKQQVSRWIERLKERGISIRDYSPPKVEA